MVPKDKLAETYQLRMQPWWDALGRHRAELVQAERRLRDAEAQLDRVVAQFLRNQVQGAVIAALGPTVATIYGVFLASKAIVQLAAAMPSGGTAVAAHGTALAAKGGKLLAGNIGAVAGTTDKLFGHLSALIEGGRALHAIREIKEYHARTTALLQEVERVIRCNGVGVRFDARA
jgi:hypothetical protein